MISYLTYLYIFNTYVYFNIVFNLFLYKQTIKSQDEIKKLGSH